MDPSSSPIDDEIFQDYYDDDIPSFDRETNDKDEVPFKLVLEAQGNKPRKRARGWCIYCTQTRIGDDKKPVHYSRFKGMKAKRPSQACILCHTSLCSKPPTKSGQFQNKSCHERWHEFTRLPPDRDPPDEHEKQKNIGGVDEANSHPESSGDSEHGDSDANGNDLD
jgi:hypothetical protein